MSSASRELREATQAQRQQLRAGHEAAAALCLKLGVRGCKELRAEEYLSSYGKGLSAAELTLLGTLGSVLPALEQRIAMVRVAPGSRPPSWSQNEIKVLVDAEMNRLFIAAP